jgi:hypothetical protein
MRRRILRVAIFVIYRNSVLADQIRWTLEPTADAATIAWNFLRSEYDLLRLARVETSSVGELESFLRNTVNQPLTVERSAGSDVLVRAGEGETLLVTGKTAEVLCSYIDSEPVNTEDRDDMTLHRAIVR